MHTASTWKSSKLSIKKNKVDIAIVPDEYMVEGNQKSNTDNKVGTFISLEDNIEVIHAGETVMLQKQKQTKQYKSHLVIDLRVCKLCVTKSTFSEKK